MKNIICKYDFLNEIFPEKLCPYAGLCESESGCPRFIDQNEKAMVQFAKIQALKDPWSLIERNLANVKAGGIREVGQDLPPTYTSKKPRHVPEPGKTWSAWVREKNLGVKSN